MTFAMWVICTKKSTIARIFYSMNGKSLLCGQCFHKKSLVTQLPEDHIRKHVFAAIKEDVGKGDVTTNSLISSEHHSNAQIVAREDIIFCGSGVASEVFRQLDEECVIQTFYDDGALAPKGSRLMGVSAKTRALLTGERTALNYLQRMSGVATLCSHYVQAVSDYNTILLDTRKTTPGWRLLEKYAVQCGGARNHRRTLDEMIFIKDNHLASMEGPHRIEKAVKQARQANPEIKIEVEADTAVQAKQAAAAGADIILLDNMTPVEIKEALRAIGEQTQTEASGGITINNIQDFAQTGVQFISIGAFTHSAQSVDLSMEISQ